MQNFKLRIDVFNLFQKILRHYFKYCFCIIPSLFLGFQLHACETFLLSTLCLFPSLLFPTFFCFSGFHSRHFILVYPPVTIFFSSAVSNLLLLSHVELSISNILSSNFITSWNFKSYQTLPKSPVWSSISLNTLRMLFLKKIFICLFIYLFLAALGLSCGTRDLFVVVCGHLSSCGAQAQQLQHMGLAALWHVGSQFPDQRQNPPPLHWKADS